VKVKKKPFSDSWFFFSGLEEEEDGVFYNMFIVDDLFDMYAPDLPFPSVDGVYVCVRVNSDDTDGKFFSFFSRCK
jgi:hypothetical protein